MIKKQLLYSLIFSYIAVMVVGVGLYISLNIIAIESIEEEITKNYEGMLDSLEMDMKYIVEDMKEVVLGIKEKVGIRELLSSEEEIDDEIVYEDNYKFVKAVNDLAEIRSYNSFIGETYIYYDEYNKIINRKGTYSPDIAYKIFHKGQRGYYSEWLASLGEEYYKGKIVSIGNQLAYVQTIANYNKENKANVVVIFDEKRLKLLAKESRLAEYGYVGILDEQNNIYLSNLSDEKEEQVEKIIKEIKQEYTKKYTFLIKEDEENGFRYVGAINKKIFTQKVSYINKVFFIFASVFIVIILIGAYVIYKKYYAISDMINKIKNSVGISKDNQYGELEYIGQALVSMSKELKGDRARIVENILRKAIQGTTQNEEEIEKYLGKQFKISHFIIGSLILVEKDNKNAMEVNSFIIQNIFEEVLGDSHRVYTLEYANGYILIINFQDIVDEYVYEEVIHRLSVGRIFLEEKFRLPNIIALSDIHSEIGSLAMAYEEVQKALEYRMFFNKDKTVVYSQIIKEDTMYSYSMEDQIYLIKAIKEGAADKAIEFLKEIFKRNFNETKISLGNTKKLIADISVTLEQTEHEMGIEKMDLIKQLHKKKTLEEIEIAFREIIKVLCDNVQLHKEKKLNDKIQKIIVYIEAHYCEEDLTVTSIAEVFDMKVSYISRFFKENTGENLLQYITKRRIIEAKKLLIETPYNLNEIAEQVGLLNNVALIRSFKKYEYITPNEYRNANK